jgi:hypothetical protein
MWEKRSTDARADGYVQHLYLCPGQVGAAKLGLLGAMVHDFDNTGPVGDLKCVVRYCFG